MSYNKPNIVGTAVFVEACDKVLDAYKEEHKLDELTPDQIGATLRAAKILVIDDNVRSASNCKWQTITANVSGSSGGLYYRVKGERNSGTIAPIDEKSLMEMNKTRKQEYGPLKLREYSASINITKYDVWIETDESGAPVKELPDDDHLSSTYKALWYRQCIINEYLEGRIKQGLIVTNSKNAKSPACVVAKNIRIASTVQTHVSDDAKKNAGVGLVNPIARVTIPFDKTSGMPSRNVKFYDKTKPFGKGFEELKYDGDSITSLNVHKIVSGSIIDGIIQADAICYSQMAISAPLNWKLMVVQPPVKNEISLDDMFDAGDDEVVPSSENVEVVPSSGNKEDKPLVNSKNDENPPLVNDDIDIDVDDTINELLK